MEANKTRDIVEAGIMAVITFILMLINAFIPGMSIVTTFILPIPMVVLYLRTNTKVVVTSFIVSGILISMLNNPITGIGTTILTAFLSFSLGYCIKNRIKFSNSIFIIFIANLIGNFVDISLYCYLFLGRSLFSQVDEMIRLAKESFDEAYNIAINMNGVDSSSLEIYKNVDINMLYYILPASIILIMLISSVLSYEITGKIISRFNYKIENRPEFSKWYIDSRLIALSMMICIGGYFLQSKGSVVGNYIYLSTYSVIAWVLIVMGASILNYYLKYKFNMGKATRIVLTAFILISPLNNVLLIGAVADMILDIRGVNPNSIKFNLKKN